MIWFEEQWFDLENVWFDLDLIWNIVIWFEIIPNHYLFHNTMLLRVIDERRRPCFVLNPENNDLTETEIQELKTI